ncbi:MAG: hypothetical protein ACRBM6_36005 [Geminicoccales bacterium]
MDYAQLSHETKDNLKRDFMLRHPEQRANNRLVGTPTAHSRFDRKISRLFAVKFSEMSPQGRPFTQALCPAAPAIGSKPASMAGDLLAMVLSGGFLP